MTKSHNHRTSLVSRHLAIPLEAALLISSGIGLAFGAPELGLWMLVIWMVIATSYIVLAVRRLMLALSSPELNQILLPQDGRRMGIWGGGVHVDVIVIGIAASMGIAAAIVVSQDASLNAHPVIARIVAAFSIVLAWALVQIGFARLYGVYFYLSEGGGGLDFPATPEPGLIEFTFFAFGIGTAFQNSDVEATNAQMRMIILIHSITAFLYGSVLIAFLVSLIPAS